MMNGSSQESPQQPLYPPLYPSLQDASSPTPATTSTAKERVNFDQPSSSSSSSTSEPLPPTLAAAGGSSDFAVEKWGTHIMGAPAVPTCHPGNQKAALWGAGDNPQDHHYPYLQYTPIEKSNTSPMESILHKFNSWSHKAETTANNIWHNLRTGSSVSGAAWNKVNLTAKAITGGGFECLYKQTFSTFPDEKLKKSFACYLSTTTGPVAGTLYLSTHHAAFCSDRPLSFTAPSGQQSWSYYKVMVPLVKICAINPVVMRDNPSEKYLQVVTIDGHDFWFMGFVNYEKATRHLSESLGGTPATTFVAPGVPVQVQPPAGGP